MERKKATLHVSLQPALVVPACVYECSLNVSMKMCYKFIILLLCIHQVLSVSEPRNVRDKRKPEASSSLNTGMHDIISAGNSFFLCHAVVNFQVISRYR